jgi:SET domain-containing protein
MQNQNNSKMPHHGVYARLRPSRIHGVGVFAIKDIPKGTYIFPEDNEELVWIHKRMFRNLEPEERKLYDDFCIIRGDLYGCPRSFNTLTPAWYFNESSMPNVAADRAYRFYSLRGIKKGEELTVNYASYSDRPTAEPDLS